MRIASATMLTMFVLFIPAAAASAARVPPGNSAATQYSETVPGAGGEEGTRENTGGAGKSPTVEGGKKSEISKQTTAEFEELGPEGEAALNLARAGEPSAHASGKKSKEGKDGGNEQGAAVGAPSGPGKPGGPAGSSPLSAEASGSSGVGQVLGGAVGTSGGGLGFLQPLILATVLIAGGAYLLRRRRGGIV